MKRWFIRHEWVQLSALFIKGLHNIAATKTSFYTILVYLNRKQRDIHNCCFSDVLTFLRKKNRNICQGTVLWITHIHILLFTRSLVSSDQSPYSDVSSLRAPFLNGLRQDCRTMYNPMMSSITHGSGTGIGLCTDQYMRPPQGLPPHSMMGHRGMPPPDGESISLHVQYKYYFNLG